MDLTWLQWACGVTAAFLVGFSKTGVVGLGILIVPLVAALFPSEQSRLSMGALLPMLILGDVFAVVYYRRHADWRVLGRLLPWVAPGLLVGWAALGNVPDRAFKPALGWLVLVMIGLNFLKERSSGWLDQCLPRQMWFSALMGFLAGFTTMVGNVAGPIMSVYLLSMGAQKREFMGTGAWYYLIVNAVKVPFYVGLGLMTADTLVFNAKTALVIVAGALVGIPVFHRLSQAWFNRLIIVLAAAAALKLALSPWIGG